ncbi:hypothetical protein [Algibacillus agarilyticus]|uniref:hypothetical protein n=1 Tax=Algibacillus agarilyticus TaxID=2234133 RepID=UPI001300AC22
MQQKQGCITPFSAAFIKKETSVKKGLKAKRFKTALASDYADKVFQLVFLSSRNLTLAK